MDAPAQGLRGQGVRVHAVDCDLTEPAAGVFLAAAVAERALEVSVLRNNAGAAIAGELTTYRVERQVAVLRLSSEATVDLCGRFVPSMVRRGQRRGARRGLAVQLCAGTPVGDLCRIQG